MEKQPTLDIKRAKSNCQPCQHQLLTNYTIKAVEFRKGSWDNKLKEAQTWINTNLKNMNQLVDIALTMSNTDKLACIHVYYTPLVMNGKPQYRNHSKIEFELFRSKKCWMDTVNENLSRVQYYAQR